MTHTINTPKKTVVYVNDTQMVSIFKGLENRPTVPFVSVTMKRLFDDWTKKSKIDGSINPFWKKEVYKTDTKTYRLVTDYESRVHNNLIKEGKDPNSFTVESPKGKKHISKCVLTDKETETILYVMVEWFPEIKGTTPIFEFEGNVIDKSQFENWVTNYGTSNEKQGLNREVTPITPKFQSIVSFRVDGIEYVRLND
jgi:hypothetical protein